MPYHTGLPYVDGDISIGAPDVEQIRSSAIDDDVRGAVEHYLATAPLTPGEYYFCIFAGETPVGQILLHDINWATGESLIGYCLFRPALRGRGIGRRALRLLQRFVVEQTALTRLIIITDSENHASQAIARKCGFQYIGGAREDPEQLLVFEWRIAR
jgi:ribosomal-protein-alanine N-acetyltransferase